jgi:hypothetical protein
MTATGARFLFRRQWLHALYVVALVPVAWALAAPALGDGAYLGVRDTTWFVVTVAVAIVHQVYIWAAWRTQLACRTFTRAFGRWDFAVYGVPFFAFLLLRPLLVGAVSAADPRSLALPSRFADWLATVLLLPTIWTGWSVARYFGVLRAAGGDHFRPRYREMPLVDRGAFAWTPNAMYTLAFLGLWAIALYEHSHAGLVAALFQHGYIWVHYVCTEQPDMAVIYGPGLRREETD